MATFLLEVGTEELPASFIDEALAQWRSHIPTSLAEVYLTPEEIAVYGTPRRLASQVKGLPSQQPDREEEVKGPPAKAAFKDGNPTKAAIGFAKSRGVEVEALEVRDTDKGAFVFVQQQIPGRPTSEILIELAPQWIVGLEGKRFMRWGDGDLKFPRPIRWLITLLDDQVLPLTLENGAEQQRSGNQSQGHRVLHPEPIQIPHADQYISTLREAYVEVDPARRKEKIQSQVETSAASVNGSPMVSDHLLQEVVNLVEWPTAVVGQFDPSFLEIPDEVTVIEMEGHQRYFPITENGPSSKLLPYFITISNGDPTKSDLIAAGNGRVIRARLSDGKFFFDADRKQPLADYLPRLEEVTFQEKLGSMRDKVTRLSRIAARIATQLQVSQVDQTQISRTALLCKADLVTQMVGEFPELQGVMGQKYALSSGESDGVATGIAEHYLPRGAGDELPRSLTGRVVGLADRLDTLVGIFSIGMIPSGSSDPFALRRAANAVLNIIWDGELSINLNQLLEQVVQDAQGNGQTTSETTKGNEDSASLFHQLQDFFLQRLRTLLQEEQSIDYDLVNAVLGEADPEYTQRCFENLLDTRDRAHFLQVIRSDGRLANIYETVNRSARLASQGTLDTVQLDPVGLVNPKLFQQSSEQRFYDALMQLLPQTQSAQVNRDYQTLLNGMTAITPIVSQFFDGPDSVLVMDSDPDIQQNRLSLLGLLRNHARVLADFGAIVKQ